MHSLAVRERRLQPWTNIQRDGVVLAAHCTCMAGLGEACTHVSSMLWGIYSKVKVNQEKSVTDSKAYWLPCSAAGSSMMGTVKNTDFTSAKAQKKRFDDQFVNQDPYKPFQRSR